MIVLLVCLSTLLLFRAAEPLIRFTGLFLQLLGISTVLYGISETRKLFNCPSLLSVASRWLTSFPKFRLPKRTVRLVGQAGEMSFAGRVIARHQAGPNATIEDRVRVLESNLQLIDHRMDELQQQIDQANRQTNQALAAERQTREHDIDHLRKKLEITETGGLYVSLMGLVWLIVGLMMSTASLELSNLF